MSHDLSIIFVAKKISNVVLAILHQPELMLSQVHRIFDLYNTLSSQGLASPGALNAIKGAAEDIREASKIAFQEWSKQASAD